MRHNNKEQGKKPTFLKYSDASVKSKEEKYIPPKYQFYFWQRNNVKFYLEK